MVCLFVRVSLVDSERVSAKYGAVLADRPFTGSPRIQNDKHTTFFQGGNCRSTIGEQP
jgi:hypothetical protein